ncbi:MAG: radical SAM protein [Candidatus Omnitrophica bacterium]|nr:radical SAM protein [Candidatus Omnitrophota bacterium]MCF7877793.1 radical SAM protein [Candidatus Omnitrophota bacterium]MCF7878650.1 radical SAM protein [Candidatus Omnitrophota bacterium]MCF7892601.1 radical SAM protein [Candidatus Omnitrophota bacterium]
MELIKPFDPWRSSLCSCPPKYSLSAYTGCGHGCLYCYASSYIPKFYQPRPKKDFIKKLRKDAAKIPPGSTIAISNSSDPYQPLEKKLKLTHQLLNILKNYDLKINLVTKSNLILEDLGLLKEIKKILITISLTSLDDNLSKKLEPNCTLPSERLKAVKKLSEFMPVVVRFDPLIYHLNTKDIKKVIRQIKEAGAKQIITSTYKAKTDNFKRMTKVFPEYLELWHKLYYQKGMRKNNYIYLEENIRKSLIEKARKESMNVRLQFSTCREGIQDLNTANCDGTSFF